MSKNMISRRQSLQLLGGAGAGLLSLSMPAIAQQGAGRVIVVGGGFGGATAAKYIKRANSKVQVTLLEPRQRYYTCPLTNLHFGGLRTFEQ